MDNPQAQQQGGNDQLLQAIQGMLQQGAQPVEVAFKLLQQVPPEEIMAAFVQIGMPEQEAQGAIQEAMQGGQQQQGPGEEQMEGIASNPQEGQMEGVPQGGQPQAPQDPMMAFGGPAYTGISKAFSSTAPQNVNSDTYVQDRQADFINTIKRNTLMSHMGANPLPEAPGRAYGGDLPKASDGYDVTQHASADAAELAARRHYDGLDEAGKKTFDWKAESGKWKTPAPTYDQNKSYRPDGKGGWAEQGVSSPQAGQDQIAQAIAAAYQQRLTQQQPNIFGASPLGRLLGTSHRGQGQTIINDQNVPVGFNYADLFNPGKGAGSTNGQNWRTTSAEDITGGLFNRKVVGKKYNIAWGDPNQVPQTPVANAVPAITPVDLSVQNDHPFAERLLSSGIMPLQKLGARMIPFDNIQNQEQPFSTSTQHDIIPATPYVKPQGVVTNELYTEPSEVSSQPESFNPRQEEQSLYEFGSMTPEEIAARDAANNSVTPVVNTPVTPTVNRPVQNKKPASTPSKPKASTPSNSSHYFGNNEILAEIEKYSAATKADEKLAKQKKAEKLAKEKRALAALPPGYIRDYISNYSSSYGYNGIAHSDLSNAINLINKAFGGQMPKAAMGLDTGEEDFDQIIPDNLIKPQTEAEKLLEYQRGYNERLGMVDPKFASMAMPGVGTTSNPINNPDSTVEIRNKKGKLNVNWDAAADFGKQTVDSTANFFEKMRAYNPDRRAALMSSANSPHDKLSNQGYDQFGNFMGGTDTGAQILNPTDTMYNEQNPVYSLGGKLYELGGDYDLSDEEVAHLKSKGFNVEKL